MDRRESEAAMRRTLLLLLLLLLTTACRETAGPAEDGQDDDPDPGAGVVARVDIVPASSTINAIGYATTLAATARDGNGAAVSEAPLAWTSLDPAIAGVESDGRVVARAVGSARIRAASGAAADTASVTVRQVVATLSVTPATYCWGSSILGTGVAGASNVPVKVRDPQ
jgi:hypothetical protein